MFSLQCSMSVAPIKRIHKGKVKEVWKTNDPKILQFKYTDNVSVFDKIIPSSIPRKGEMLNKTSSYWFQMIEEAGICDTHYIEMDSPTTCLVKKMNIYDKVPKDEENVFIPLEFISRYYLTGSLWRRVQDGEISKTSLGYHENSKLHDGLKLPKPYIEMTTKFEPFDRVVSKEEALQISNCTEDEIDSVIEKIIAIDELIDDKIRYTNLIHVDGKKEFGLGKNRVPIVVDSLGTLDEDRWWDLYKYISGGSNDQMSHLSKEFIRKYYKDSGYEKKLLESRKFKRTEPDIEALPEHMIQEASDLYKSMYVKICT